MVRLLFAAVVAAAAILGLLLLLLLVYPERELAPRGIVRVVPPAGTATSVAPAIGAVAAKAGAESVPILVEAPTILRSLHAAVVDDAVQDAAAASQIRTLFTAIPGLTVSSVSCGSRRCEVQGNALAGESVTRLRLRDPRILDALSSRGMTAGMDMVRETKGSSSFVLFVDRAPDG